MTSLKRWKAKLTFLRMAMVETLSTNLTESKSEKRVVLVPGSVQRGRNFSIQYVTPDGGSAIICKIPGEGMAFTTLRSPSGTGKSTLLECFIRQLRDRTPTAQGSLAFVATDGRNLPPSLSIGVVPQNPPFVKHWPLHKLLPTDPWTAPEVFGSEKWKSIRSRLMGELSGGEQRRVYACSVLEFLHQRAGDAIVLVLDETLDGLNPQGAGRFIEGIAAGWSSRGEARPLYVLLVTHLPTVATKIPELVRATLEVVAESSAVLRVSVMAAP